jgi:hypothetical protein
MCDCEFDKSAIYDDDIEEESCHYKRTCAHCGNIWYGLHCPHDGIQNPCPRCKTLPKAEGK